MRNALISSQTLLSLELIGVLLFISRRVDVLLLSSIISRIWGVLGKRKGMRVRQTRKYTTTHFRGVSAMLFPLHCFALG